MKLRNKKTGGVVYVNFQIPLSNNHELLEEENEITQQKDRQDS